MRKYRSCKHPAADNLLGMISIILGVILLTFVSSANAQMAMTNWVSVTQAVQLASHLTVGMPEEKATEYLERNGLKTHGSFGDSFGWCTPFALQKPFSLCLDIRPKKFRPDGAWADGLLQSACIQSNGVKIVSIKLTNAP
jgi:hypothetical protein